jgi:dipeptidyl aminopeptidase/acylaminoacyl peptidase
MIAGMMNARNLAALLLAALPLGAPAAELTLEQIMADADWLGNAPEDAFWGADNRTAYFEQKRQGSRLTDLYSVDTADGAIAQVAESNWSSLMRRSAVYSEAGDLHAWVYAGDIYMSDGEGIRQVTRTTAPESNPAFMTDGRRITFQRDQQYFVFDPETGLVEQVTNIRFEKDPGAEKDFDVLQAHQRRLYEQLRKAERDKDEARERERSLFALDDALPAAPVYLGDDLAFEGHSLSPGGRWLLVVTSKKSFDEGKAGTMPNYVTLSGHVETRELRQRVGRNGPAPHALWLIDLDSGEKHALGFGDLPGIGDDPLTDVRRSAVDYFVEQGEDRDNAEKRLEAPEERAVMVWQTSWSSDGKNVALYVRSVDNKDRWIATVDFEDRKVVSQHRLHDEAWVNPYHIEHGWLKDGETLWFLSEDHGYLGIYTKHVGERRSKALVAGEHVVFDPALGPSGRYLYYRANVEQPGVYEIWRVNVESRDAEQLTALGGMNEFSVSPDESRLLITHSSSNRHPELYVQDNRPGVEAQQLTDTMSDTFRSIAWQEPAIVPVPSSHSEQPIYSKIYVPANHDPAKPWPAVVFVHGAGYLQNSDFGWPDYFREQMFHNLLAQHGYVVIDMDYRASEGYGRDWRTAIYRRMGVPELEDFHDGVDYLVENYGVNRERVGIYGGSYGGFMAFTAMFSAPGTFQAGAALRPVSDWAHYNHGYTSNILNTPDLDPRSFYISSPINFVEGLEGALLIQAGMQDDNVFFQDAVLVVQRLIELKKENWEIAIYPQDPHGYVYPESWLDGYRRIFKLFEEHLK